MHISYHSKRWLIAGLVLCAVAAPRANDLTLFDAVKHRDLESVRTLIRQHADVNAPQGDGSTALHWAARVDDVAIADVLIRAGARPNTANDVGATPLHLACINGSAAMVDRLLKAGARADGAFVNGETVLMTCARSGNAATVKSLLVHARHIGLRSLRPHFPGGMTVVTSHRLDEVLAANHDIRLRRRRLCLHPIATCCKSTGGHQGQRRQSDPNNISSHTLLL